ncbi:TPA: hypothetical protein MO340_004301 [Salmonella enterica subsp. salamae serovar 35:g,m,s,t:-]|nr:hypothetical protein [Salmonella enterica subsp. salamae serovar 35:g,m,s,t:-]HCA3549771.1 hypothetical protein [Salmonella enterica subsp. salamae serovar 35:g,m,s,t:-]
MTRQQCVAAYLYGGYSEVAGNLSGIDTAVLIKGSKIVRIGGDAGYAHFARLVWSGTSGLTNVPVIYKHAEPLGQVNNLNNNSEYSVTEMEVLTPLTELECKDYENWSKPAIRDITKGNIPSTDPFNLVDDIIILVKYAAGNDLGIDIVESKNIMKRNNDFIILDPFI